METINFNGKKWLPGVVRNTSVFHIALVGKGDEYSKKLWGLPPKDLLQIVINGQHMAGFFEEKKLQAFESRVIKTFRSEQSIKSTWKKYRKFGNALVKASEDLESKTSVQSYENFILKYSILTNGLWLTAIAGRIFHTMLLKKLAEQYTNKSGQELDFLAGILTYPNKHTPLMDSQISLLHIGAKLQETKATRQVVEKMLSAHLKAFGFVPVNFNEEAWSKQDIKNQLKAIMKGDCKKELSEFLNNHEKKVKLALEAVRRLKSKQSKLYAIVLQNVTAMNEYRKFVFCRASYAQHGMFKQIAKRHRLGNWRELFRLMPQEISDLYFKRQKENLNLLKKRQIVAFIYDHTRQKYEFFSRQDVVEFLNAMSPKLNLETSGVSELKGNIASPGLVKGIAKIVLSRQDFKKFKSGDILIAPMTSVDFVPIMKLAAAFVTNEGGITSHASIVSREMNKPCIIGTKISTKVFKDGDMVEVDANKGIVRKI